MRVRVETLCELVKMMDQPAEREKMRRRRNYYTLHHALTMLNYGQANKANLNLWWQTERGRGGGGGAGRRDGESRCETTRKEGTGERVGRRRKTEGGRG